MDKGHDSRHDRGFSFDQEKATAYADWDLTKRISNNAMLSKYVNIVKKYIKELADTNRSDDNTHSSHPNVLDVGCGSGALLDHMISRLNSQSAGKLEVHGIDISEAMISIAKQQYEENACSNKIPRSFSIMDMHSMADIEDKSIDFMFSCYVLHFSETINELLTHLASKMKKGSRLTAILIGADPKEGKTFPAAYMVDKWIPLSLPNGIVKNYGHTVTEWISAMVGAGFTVSEVLRENCNYVLAEGYIFKNDIDLLQVIFDVVFK